MTTKVKNAIQTAIDLIDKQRGELDKARRERDWMLILLLMSYEYDNDKDVAEEVEKFLAKRTGEIPCLPHDQIIMSKCTAKEILDVTVACLNHRLIGRERIHEVRWMGDFFGINVDGLFLGIERDGHIHS